MRENKEKKFYNQIWFWLIITVINAVIFISIVINLSNINKQVNSNIFTQNSKELNNNDIIVFAKKEIQKKLKHPETSFFSDEKVSFQDERYIVECYCTSKNGNNQETKVKFVTIIKKYNNNLQLIDMMTNGETCTRDAKAIVESLIKQEKYDEIFNNWFSTTEKNTMDYNKFINYLNDFPIDLKKATFKEKETEETKKIELFIEEENNQNREYVWCFTFLNGQVYNFDIALKY